MHKEFSMRFLAALLIFIAPANPLMAQLSEKTPSENFSNQKSVIDEATWQILMEEPGSYFLQAMENLSKNNKKAAARDIRKGVNIINIEILWASKDIKPKLSNASEELLIFANELNKNKNILINSLNRSFFRVEIILAELKLTKAKKFILQDDYRRAIFSLEAAARHILYSQTWSENKLTDKEIRVIKDVQELMLVYVEKGDWDKQKIRETKNLLQKMLEKI